MKKIEVSENIKKIIFAGLVLFTVIFGILIIKELLTKHTKDVEKTSNIYAINSAIDYKVNFKPNKIYNKSMGKGYQYMAGYVNNIPATFDFSLISSKDIDFKITYNISSKIEAFVTEDEKEIIIWEKDMNNTELKENSGKNELIINEGYNFDYEAYTRLIREITDELKVSFNSRALIKMNAVVSWIDETGTEIKEYYSPIMTVPLNKGYFAIQEAGIQPVSKDIKTIVTEVLPINQKAVLVYGLTFIISVAVIILFIKNVKVVSETFKSTKYNARKKIFDEYGSRLVAIKEDNNTFQKVYPVKDILDLSKIADELEKPIFYVEDIVHTDGLYIIDGDIKYSYNF